MPTIISHAAVPLAVGLGLSKDRVPRRLLLAGAIASMLPDADVILFRLGATYDSAWAHRGFTHSIGFAIVLGLCAAVLLRRDITPIAAFTFIAGAALSHGLLDMLTNGGHGVAIFWPVSSSRYFFNWRPIQVSPLAATRFMHHAAAVFRTEFIWIWIPSCLVLLTLRAIGQKLEA